MTRNSQQGSLPSDAVARAVAVALAEDHAAQDVTTRWTVPASLRVRAHVEARAAGTIAGLQIVGVVFRQIDAEVQVCALVRDGDRLRCGERVLEIDGPARSILTGERVALNFLQRLSGIATTAAGYVARVHDLPVKILDTRKTAPGLRLLDKYAVACGGATNHRPDLSAMVLIRPDPRRRPGLCRHPARGIRQRHPAFGPPDRALRGRGDLGGRTDALGGCP